MVDHNRQGICCPSLWHTEECSSQSAYLFPCSRCLTSRCYVWLAWRCSQLWGKSHVNHLHMWEDFDTGPAEQLYEIFQVNKTQHWWHAPLTYTVLWWTTSPMQLQPIRNKEQAHSTYWGGCEIKKQDKSQTERFTCICPFHHPLCHPIHGLHQAYIYVYIHHSSSMHIIYIIIYSCRNVDTCS